MVGKDTSRRAGLTPERVVSCACTLTKDRGLQGWTVRDLAAALDVVPSVVYHYFPTKKAIHDGIRDQVCAGLTWPEEGLDWQDWFIQVLTALRATLLDYNGLTHHLKESFELGVPPRPLLPLFEAAIAQLDRAGFGENVIPAYAMIINVSLGAIEQRDRQSVLSADRHDITAMVAQLGTLTEESPALARLREGLPARLPTPEGEEISENYFRLLIRSLLTGIEHELRPSPTTGQSRRPVT